MAIAVDAPYSDHLLLLEDFSGEPATGFPAAASERSLSELRETLRRSAPGDTIPCQWPSSPTRTPGKLDPARSALPVGTCRRVAHACVRGDARRWSDNAKGLARPRCAERRRRRRRRRAAGGDRVRRVYPTRPRFPASLESEISRSHLIFRRPRPGAGGPLKRRADGRLFGSAFSIESRN
jgi:hypothetical protein